MSDELTPRPAVMAFARLMERELRANDHKGGRENWLSVPPRRLFTHLESEVREAGDVLSPLIERVAAGDKPTAAGLAVLLAGELADIANMAMMVADRCGCLDEFGVAE